MAIAATSWFGGAAGPPPQRSRCGRLVGGGDREHLGHIPVGVVVGEDGSRQVAALAAAVAAQVGRGGEDGVGRVVDVADPVAVSIHRVGAEGVAGLAADPDLHGPGRAGEVGTRDDPRCLQPTVVGLDLADGGQHRPGQPGTGVRPRSIEGQVVRGNLLLGGRAGGAAAEDADRHHHHQADQERDEDAQADQQLCHGSSRKAGVSFGSGQDHRGVAGLSIPISLRRSVVGDNRRRRQIRLWLAVD